MEFPSNPFDATRPFMPTIGDRLSAKDISWKWYSDGWDNCPSRKSRSTLNQRITDQTPFGQETRRGSSPPEKSKFLLLIDVSVSAAFNELVVEPVQQKIRQPTTAEDEGGQTAGLPGLQIRRPVEIAK